MLSMIMAQSGHADKTKRGGTGVPGATMWRCVRWRGRTQTRAGCSWPSPGCSGRSSELSGCPGWSSPGTSGIQSPRSGPSFLGQLQVEGRRRRRGQGGLAMEEIRGLRAEAVGQNWLAVVEVWGGVQGRRLLQTYLETEVRR